MDSSPTQRDIDAVNRISAVPSILRAVSGLTGMRLAFVARVTPDSWTACAVTDDLGFGLSSGTQLDVNTTFCKEVCEGRTAIMMGHASIDPVYRTHQTPKLYKFESYISLPVYRTDGSIFGTLCALDSKPLKIESKTVESMQLFAELISGQLKNVEQLQAVEKTLWDERQISELREQFIAVVSHDIRNPLGAIAASTSALLEEQPRPDQLDLLKGIEESSGQMARLIEQVLDFARGRLGGGISLETLKLHDIGKIIRSCVSELQRIHRERIVHLSIGQTPLTSLDEVRARQLFSNIIGNALQHSHPGEPVTISVTEIDASVCIKVANKGNPLPDAMTDGHTFSPFVRRSDEKKNPGLGLGVYIASEIAKAHGGELKASHADGQTVFTLLLPLPKSSHPC